MAGATRIVIGFEASPPLGMRVQPEDLDKLKAALEAGEGGWYDVDALDGGVRLNLAKVVYVRIEADEHRVGF
jgi:hypothetical protein